MKIEVNPHLVKHSEYLVGSGHSSLVLWLGEYVGQIFNESIFPYHGAGWKCHMTFDPHHFKLNHCTVEFADEVNESIIAMFILKWT